MGSICQEVSPVKGFNSHYLSCFMATGFRQCVEFLPDFAYNVLCLLISVKVGAVLGKTRECVKIE